MAAGQDNSPAKRGAGSRVLRMLLVALIGIVVAAILLVTVPPAGLIKDQIERAASTASGRTITIGDAEVKLWPMPSVSLSNVAMANPDGVTRPPLLQAQSINARLKLKPLFSGKAEIESFEIN